MKIKKEKKFHPSRLFILGKTSTNRDFFFFFFFFEQKFHPPRLFRIGEYTTLIEGELLRALTNSSNLNNINHVILKATHHKLFFVLEGFPNFHRFHFPLILSAIQRLEYKTFHELQSVDKNILNKSDNEIAKLLLYSSSSKFKLQQNRGILRFSIRFTVKSERFSRSALP